jgi:hypothetical protein
MAIDTDRAHVRLAELVAALSLGVDLGFGTELRQGVSATAASGVATRKAKLSSR